GGVQAVEVAHRTKRIDLALVDRRRTARAGGGADVVGAGGGGFPQRLAVAGPQKEDAPGPPAFGPPGGVRGLVSRAGVVRQKDASCCERGASISALELGAPDDLGAALGKRLKQTGLAPDAVAPGAQPLRPIVSIDLYAIKAPKRRQNKHIPSPRNHVV